MNNINEITGSILEFIIKWSNLLQWEESVPLRVSKSGTIKLTISLWKSKDRLFINVVWSHSAYKIAPITGQTSLPLLDEAWFTRDNHQMCSRRMRTTSLLSVLLKARIKGACDVYWFELFGDNGTKCCHERRNTSVKNDCSW